MRGRVESLSSGAASRPGALFCQQCGNSVTRTSDLSDVAAGTAQQDDSSEPPLDSRLQTQKLDLPERAGRPQVEKLRRASTVVLSEASYDASLRFVLVAAVLFVLFLVILLLSKIIT